MKYKLILLVSLIGTVSISLSAQGALSISDGSQFVPKDAYPKFSWDTTPMYYMFGEIDRVLKPEEVDFIAERTNFICIEKSHGFNQLGASELGAKHEISAFKKVKPEIKALFYLNSAYAWPYTTFNKDFLPERINDHPELKKFLIVDPETGELAFRDHYIRLVYFFDVLNPDFRSWWVDNVAKGVEISGADGAFIDQMHGFAHLRPDKASEVEKAQGQLMAALKEKLGPDKIVLGNNAANVDQVFPTTDAFMFEHHNYAATDKEILLKEWDDMVRIAKAGKISVFRFGAKPTGTPLEKADRETKKKGMLKLSQQQAEYYLACYLIGAQPYSYFQYNWGWNLPNGNLVNYPEFSKPLGVPKEAYKRTTSDGWEFTREFEHASVWVDTEKREAKITWR